MFIKTIDGDYIRMSSIIAMEKRMTAYNWAIVLIYGPQCQEAYIYDSGKPVSEEALQKTLDSICVNIAQIENGDVNKLIQNCN